MEKVSAVSDALDLGRFLDQHAGQGQLDSQGAITVDHGRALRTLARFSLPFEYAWVLRVVQAAVKAKSQTLEVRRYRGFTAFEFRPDKAPREPEVVQALLSLNPGAGEPVDLLAQGLRALVEQAGLSFRLEIPDSRPIQAGADGAALERLARPWKLEPFAGVRLLVLHLALARSALARYLPEWAMAERPDLHISSVLEKHAFLSPIPIRLDGRRVDGLLAHSEWGFTPELRPVLLTALPWSNEAEKVISLHAHPRRAQRTCQDFRGHSNWLYLRSYGAVESLSWENQLKARREFAHQWVFYVSHGVIVERLSLKQTSCQSQLLVVVDSSDMPTDLGGLAPRQLPYGSDRPALRELLAAASLHLSRLASRVSFTRPDRDSESGTDLVEIRRANASLKRARALLPRASDRTQERLATVFAMGGRLLDRQSDPADISDDIATDWEAGLRGDLAQLSALEMASFEVANSWT